MNKLRYTWQLLVLFALLLLLGILLWPRLMISFSFNSFFFCLAAYTVINLLAYLTASRGIRKSNKEGSMFLLGALGLKFLLYLLLILAFWLITKNLSKDFILMFFTLYLVFTFFTAAHLLKLLKNK